MSSSTPTANASGEVSYLTQRTLNKYNAAGQRVKKIENDQTTKYYYSGSATLYTTNANNQLLTENILDLGGSIVASLRFADQNVSTPDPYANQYFFYNYDMRGSTTAIIQPDGTLIKGYSYDEFGALEQSGATDFLNEVTFTGSVTDTSSGLQYMNARFYSPSTGRFLSQDTYTGNAGQPWTQHLYSYCGNNPVNMVDPTGHYAIWGDDDSVKYDRKTGKTTEVEQKTIIDGSNSNKSGKSYEERQIIAAFAYPWAALNVRPNRQDKNSKDVSSSAERFPVNMGLNEVGTQHGSQVNAVRHTLWQATITSWYGQEAAQAFGWGHEEYPDLLADYYNLGLNEINAEFVNIRFTSSALADSAADQMNNLCGQAIGLKESNKTMKDIASDVLCVYHNYGLYETRTVQENGIDYYQVFQNQLSDSEYYGALDKLSRLDDYGRQQ